MKVTGIVLAAWAYTFGTWGYILIKGYNITFKDWVTPFHPYSGPWPPKCVPPGYLLPTTKAAGVDCAQKPGQGTGSNSPGVQRANRAAQQAGRVRPGQVGGRF